MKGLKSLSNNSLKADRPLCVWMTYLLDVEEKNQFDDADDHQERCKEHSNPFNK